MGHFRDVLPLLGGEGWEEFYEVAHSTGEISIGRPFYPYAPGQKKQEHLTAALGIPIDQLRRVCEKPTATHGAACPLFWTIGANQVGKGAIAGWQELVAPLVRDAGAALWPFDGDIADLIASHFLTIAETYPAEYYKPLGFGPSGWSKRKQPDRAARAPMILDAVAVLSATVAPDVAALVTDGFGEGPEGEDPFDAVVGLLGMLMALGDGAEAPTAESIRTVEGWILGQPPQ